MCGQAKVGNPPTGAKNSRFGIQNREAGRSREVGGVEGEQSRDSVGFHGCQQMSVVNAFALEVAGDDQCPDRLISSPAAGSMRREGEACLAPTKMRCRGRACPDRAPRRDTPGYLRPAGPWSSVVHRVAPSRFQRNGWARRKTGDPLAQPCDLHGGGLSITGGGYASRLAAEEDIREVRRGMTD